MWKEFKEFIMRGNVLDLAIAVVIGAAFNSIVSSLVENIITPIIGVLTGGIDFTNDFVWKYGDASVKFGAFVQSIIDFLIISFSIFIALKVVNTYILRKKKEVIEEPPAKVLDPKEELLKEIRDLLKKENG
ncbi:large conductance mechanosensitive channel protein MscL [Lysinibacillus odysseyi]|uniref:Large-conductance mechanosensitive channel n=1 Tax=Lysinibacillus odysseyi 34hs-1 = NBRC 100172 TaxID=1220589 RepID=A0A0A3IH87_9BACI|nr:large conductance mechanosensitive channel protein MscL [Lysinibacillus odysseyi]KGR82193.1 Large-conductance mechanosensitive channel [Lysinibacillus odysseyi 34hs-1 = NBRC 100172]